MDEEGCASSKLWCKSCINTNVILLVSCAGPKADKPEIIYKQTLIVMQTWAIVTSYWISFICRHYTQRILPPKLWLAQNYNKRDVKHILYHPYVTKFIIWRTATDYILYTTKLIDILPKIRTLLYPLKRMSYKRSTIRVKQTCTISVTLWCKLQARLLWTYRWF